MDVDVFDKGNKVWPSQVDVAPKDIVGSTGAKTSNVASLGVKEEAGVWGAIGTSSGEGSCLDNKVDGCEGDEGDVASDARTKIGNANASWMAWGAAEGMEEEPIRGLDTIWQTVG